MPIRPVRPSDFSGINALHRSVWWQERSIEGWQWMAANPAHADIDAPAGLVAEDANGHPTAFLGNFVQRFWQGDRLHHGATGYSLIVSNAARGRSRSLVTGLVNQPGVFCSYIFNANPKASGLYNKMGMSPWPESTHALKLSWIVDPLACLGGVLLRKAASRKPEARIFKREWLMNDRLGSSPDLTLPTGVQHLTDFGDQSDYGRFWNALLAEGRLIADRSPEIQRWRLAEPDQTIDPVILSFSRGDTITGYAYAQLEKGNTVDAAFLEVIDLIALDDEAEAIPALMSALIDNAFRLGAAKVRLQVLNDRLVSKLGHHAKTARREGGWGHCFVAFRPGGPQPDSWSPTPFDGDFGVCGRHVPISPSARGRRD